MKRLFPLLVVFLSFYIFSIAYAHPGSIDENGGHYDYSTGEYHFHHGYPAHSHTGGRCPYNFRDNTDDSYTPSKNYSVTPQYTTAPRPVTTQVQLNFFQKHPVLVGLGALAIIISIWIAIASKVEKDRERARQLQFEKEKSAAQSFYASHDLRTLTQMPDIYYVDDKNIPYEYNKPTGYTYGATLDIYISHNRSTVYHQKGCIHIRYSVPHNALSDEHIWHFRSRTPCSTCKPGALPDITWYKEYLNRIQECEKYGITPKKNPIGFIPPQSKTVEESVPVTPTLLPAPDEIKTQPAPSVPSTAAYVRVHKEVPSVIVHSHTPDSSPLHHSPISTVFPEPTILPPDPTEDDIPNIKDMYRTKYPKTWRYIQYNTPDPENYICYYHHIWGRLQEYHGDGIIYGTLTEEEQKFVDYPSVKDTVFLSSEKADSYHAVPYCYSLLKSKPIEADSIHAIVRKRCTKCVPPS